MRWLPKRSVLTGTLSRHGYPPPAWVTGGVLELSRSIGVLPLSIWLEMRSIGHLGFGAVIRCNDHQGLLCGTKLPSVLRRALILMLLFRKVNRPLSGFPYTAKTKKCHTGEKNPLRHSLMEKPSLLHFGSWDLIGKSGKFQIVRKPRNDQSRTGSDQEKRA
jgi:hypothetical protein